jgi:hypothetical protein
LTRHPDRAASQTERCRWSGPREDTAILVLFLVGVVASATVATIGWSHAISDAYGWRQTQTALSAYFMLHGGPWLVYETPLLGPPWRIPHEIPLYQALVVSLASATGLKLEAAGRAVALVSFYAALGSGYLLLAELGISARRRLLMLAFWLMSPLYFWSRTFMIESTALFLCLTFLAFSGATSPARLKERSSPCWRAASAPPSSPRRWPSSWLSPASGGSRPSRAPGHAIGRPFRSSGL